MCIGDNLILNNGKGTNPRLGFDVGFGVDIDIGCHGLELLIRTKIKTSKR